jgi:hypothetical protein
LAVDDCELADDFAKVGVDLDSHVVEVLLGSRFVHGAKCYTGRALGVKHSETEGISSATSVRC